MVGKAEFNTPRHVRGHRGVDLVGRRDEAEIMSEPASCVPRQYEGSIGRQCPPTPGPGSNRIYPKGFVSIRVLSHIDAQPHAYMATSLTRAMLTWRKVSRAASPVLPPDAGGDHRLVDHRRVDRWTASSDAD